MDCLTALAWPGVYVTAIKHMGAEGVNKWGGTVRMDYHPVSLMALRSKCFTVCNVCVLTCVFGSEWVGERKCLDMSSELLAKPGERPSV